MLRRGCSSATHASPRPLFVWPTGDSAGGTKRNPRVPTPAESPVGLGERPWSKARSQAALDVRGSTPFAFGEGFSNGLVRLDQTTVRRGATATGAAAPTVGATA